MTTTTGRSGTTSWSLAPIVQSLKRYEEAVELLEGMIGQDCYLTNHRGYWYERLALNVDQHLKDPQKVIYLEILFFF